MGGARGGHNWSACALSDEISSLVPVEAGAVTDCYTVTPVDVPPSAHGGKCWHVGTEAARVGWEMR